MKINVHYPGSGRWVGRTEADVLHESLPWEWGQAGRPGDQCMFSSSLSLRKVGFYYGVLWWKGRLILFKELKLNGWLNNCPNPNPDSTIILERVTCSEAVPLPPLSLSPVPGEGSPSMPLWHEDYLRLQTAEQKQMTEEQSAHLLLALSRT